MTDWWNKNVEVRIDDFKSWVGDYNKASKVYCRKYIADKQYKTIIDCGCGMATDYNGFKKDNYKIDYTGLDSCRFFIDINATHGIKMINAELEKDLRIVSNSYDVVYCREVLEHLNGYEKCLSELIRIGIKEVIIVFFIKPAEEDDKINYWESEDLYHNKYNKDKLEKFINDNPKVDKLFWVDVEDSNYVKQLDDTDQPPPEVITKSILHILLK